jgi:hypothetical protein
VETGAQVSRRWRRWVAVAAAALALLVVAGALAATRSGGDASPPEATAVDPPLQLAPEDIYPSLAEPARRSRRPDYAELFVTGESLAEVVMPACRRYAAVITFWSRRARNVHRDSLGAEKSPKTAAKWYAGVVWVSQDDAGELRRALTRISRARVSAATREAVKRGAVVSAFTNDALGLCELDESSSRAYARLERLDRRVADLIALARLNSSSGSEVNVIF